MKHGWEDSRTVEENVAEVLPRLCEKWFAAGEKAITSGVSWDEMHRFRLLTKRFRYTLEIFEPLYGPALGARIDLLRKLQTYLGEVNDCITAEQFVKGTPVEEAALSGLRARAERKRGEMHRYWERTFGGPGPAAAWRNYLARYAGRRQNAG